VRRRELDHIVAVIGDFFATLPSEEAYRGAQARRLPWAPINAPGELLDFPHLTEDRGAFPEIEVASIGERVRFPGAPYRFSRTPWRASTPPELGEFTPVHEGNHDYAITDR
jgi:benzylsuccinate CoA-transferase BbsE subunit